MSETGISEMKESKESVKKISKRKKASSITLNGLLLK